MRVPVLITAILLLTNLQTTLGQPIFLKKFTPLADSLSAEYGIPSTVILSVSIIESAAGTSKNCHMLNNYFGMEGKNDLKKTQGISSRYKAYPDATASFVHFCDVVSRKKFYPKLKGSKDPHVWVTAISKSGYSEIPEVWRERVSATVDRISK